MALSGWDRATSPYHAGEQELHDRLGRKDHQTNVARNIHRPYMPEQHRDFFAQLPLIFAGSVDKNGWPWASVLFGQPGFLKTPTDRLLQLGAAQIKGDPFWVNARPGASVGFVGIELPTRRRNRMNGIVRGDGTQISVDVVQSYGNCPQYIHTRDVSFHRDPTTDTAPEIDRFTDLPADVAAVITAADTLFVASHNDRDDQRDTGGVDVSHRGGNPGFVKVDVNTLTIPEYIGNFAFNTLGNFLVNPKAGLLFVDFTTGDLIQLVGTVALMWEPDDEIRSFKGAERAWRFHLDHGQVLRAAAPMTWEAREPSPNALLTGDWTQAAQTRQLEADRAAWRPFKVTKITDESSVIRSFYLEPDDGKVLMPYQPGQFLTIRVAPDSSESPLTRTYTLSSAPSDATYRISVKRDGAVSQHLHDNIKVGDIIDTRAPKGAFWMDMDEKRPAVLLAGGVGITPMISMARAALSNAVARRHHRPLTVVHAAQTTEQRAFAAEFSAFQQASQGALRYVSVISSPKPEEVAGQEFHVAGRVTPELLQSLLPLADYDFFLCGPPAFMQATYDMLIALGVRDARIFAESFGPAALTRTGAGAPPPATDAAEEAVVTFAASGVEQGWRTGDGTLLEFAEAHGMTPAFGCRSGSCGSCACKIKSGKVSYSKTPDFEPEDGQVLLCCAVPGKSEDPLILDV
ncbi:pyridoxamine 5'-phosphate oxidase family protein [Yoonia sp. SS1-5]|uniref:Pyridoxamine 5'-phosphate oxidase family protein n=1 Tax=Yoonia rhodophyticola TaxID=3137370 RepID=A0AAN0MKM3_9RHOB